MPPKKTTTASSKASSSEPKAKKEKVPKDPNAPKKNLTGYMLYSNDERPKVKAANPDLKPSEVMKELGAKWKAVDAKTKAHYLKLAAQDKERYLREVEEYNETGHFGDGTSASNGKKKKAPPTAAAAAPSASSKKTTKSAPTVEEEDDDEDEGSDEEGQGSGDEDDGEEDGDEEEVQHAAAAVNKMKIASKK